MRSNPCLHHRPYFAISAPLVLAGERTKRVRGRSFQVPVASRLRPRPGNSATRRGRRAIYSLWPGNSRTRQGLRPEDSNLTTHLCELLAKEVSVTNHHWPCVVRLGEYTAAACRVPVEGTAAYATQRVLGYLDCVRGKLVTDVTKRRPHATQAV